MKVTEDALVEVIVSLGIRNLKDLRQETGAGGGCMACRIRLQRYIDEYSPAYAPVEERVSIGLAVVG